MSCYKIAKQAIKIFTTSKRNSNFQDFLQKRLTRRYKQYIHHEEYLTGTRIQQDWTTEIAHKKLRLMPNIISVSCQHEQLKWITSLEIFNSYQPIPRNSRTIAIYNPCNFAYALINNNQWLSNCLYMGKPSQNHINCCLWNHIQIW